MLLQEKKYLPLLLIMLFLFATPKILHSQITLTAESMALGGGGTAYLTGYEALFVNPANLYIREKNYHFQISLFQGGLYYDTLLPIPHSINRYNSLRDNIRFVNGRTTLQELQTDDYETLLSRNYPGNKTSREFLTESDFYWFGLKWVRPERSFAISLRSRYASRYELGKGLFTNVPVEKNNTLIVDRSFNQKMQIFHELSFGYAESFTFLNGLLPQLSEFIIGIAPKIVLSGSSMEADFTNRYEMETGAAVWRQNLGYSQQTSGILSGYGETFFNSTGELSSRAHHSFRDLLSPAGIGAGLDIGITYLITFGDDFSILRKQNEPTEKSLRISLSVTDLGAVVQSKNPYRYSSESEENFTTQAGSRSETVFMGAPNEHYLFLSQFDDFTDLASASQNEQSFELLLPTSIQAGALLQYQRLKLVGDLSYSLSKSPFNHSGLASYIGAELRPLPYIPVRGGTRFAQDMSGTYSFGTGIETKQFDVNMSVLLKSRKIGPTTEILGGSVLGLKIYLQ